jgi:hypothetical protein
MNPRIHSQQPRPPSRPINPRPRQNRPRSEIRYPTSGPSHPPQADLFHSASMDTLTRRELDQKLLRWLESSDKAGFEKLFNGLSDSTKSYVQRFATLDLEAGETLPVDYFKRPMNPVSAAGNEDSCSGDVPESSWDVFQCR